ncbi:MAG TPA: RsfS/YbeB/iojap family protein [Acidimicrobiia bacterium]|nr:RsfS/YbeB/iojap family protein [Acidimicrobiia bacterium]
MAITAGSHASAERFHEALELCAPYVAGVFDLSDRGGAEYTIVVKGRSAAHLRKLARRVSGLLGSRPEGEAPDGSDPWLVVDGGDIVAHLLTDAALHRYGLVEWFGSVSAAPDDVFVVAMLERLRDLQEGRRTA